MTDSTNSASNQKPNITCACKRQDSDAPYGEHYHGCPVLQAWLDAEPVQATENTCVDCDAPARTLQDCGCATFECDSWFTCWQHHYTGVGTHDSASTQHASEGRMGRRMSQGKTTNLAKRFDMRDRQTGKTTDLLAWMRAAPEGEHRIYVGHSNEAAMALYREHRDEFESWQFVGLREVSRDALGLEVRRVG